MALELTERFTVRAAPARVWAYLLDPRQVVECLPGAELTEVVDERSYKGRVTVRVGPVTVKYTGRAELEEVDDAARRVRLVGNASESGSAGTARMTMVSTVTPSADGGSEISVDATVDVTGKLVQFGRGMIEDVSRQLFRQFARCVEATLAGPAVVPDDTGTATAPSGSGSAASGMPAARPPAKPVAALPLLLGAMWRAVLRLFGAEPKR